MNEVVVKKMMHRSSGALVCMQKHAEHTLMHLHNTCGGEKQNKKRGDSGNRTHGLVHAKHALYP